MAKVKLWAVRHMPWWVLRALWRAGLVKQTTVLRWEMNQLLGEWR